MVRKVSDLLTDLTYEALPKRAINEETCKTLSYATSLCNGKPCQVANYFTPDGILVAQKIRFPGKDFTVRGDLTKAGLYGQHRWRSGGKMVIVTEGEIDALSVSQMQGNKWPVVSIPTGSKGAKKALAAQLEWLEQFESVILMFDNDEPGNTAARECVDLFTPGKCKVATLPLKDANELLVAERGKEIIDAMWGAKVLRPDGIIAGTEMWERIVAVPEQDHIEYPWPKMNELLLGVRRGEIVTFCAGTGVGKSEIVGQIAHHFINNGETLGYVALEETVEETSLRLMGLHLGRRLRIDRTDITRDKLREAYDKTVGSGRVFLYDHWGSTASENLFSKIRYLVKGCGCTTIVLDHISIVVSGIETGEERRVIDNLMTKLASMVQELRCRLLLISHLRKPDGKPHEEGGRVTLDDLRGSASIKQLSYDIIALERNQQDPEQNNRTHVRVLKCRTTGKTGSAGYLIYDDQTGLLTPADASDAFASDSTNGDF